MIAVFKDRYRVALGLATASFAGILVSIYRFYRLPHDLMLVDAGHPSLVNLYLAVAITLLLGVAALWFALSYRNEVIVFRDRDEQAMQASHADNNGAGTTTSISLQQFETQIKDAADQETLLQDGLNAICKQIDAGQGALYVVTETQEGKRVALQYGYALAVSENKPVFYEPGEGLIGQAAVSGTTLYIDDIPEGYVKIISGLGSASPRYLLIAALKKDADVKGVLEIASFTPVTEEQKKFVEDAAQSLAARMTN